MKGLRPVIGKVECKCGHTEMVAPNGMRIVAKEQTLTNMGHVNRAKRRQAWGAVDAKCKGMPCSRL